MKKLGLLAMLIAASGVLLAPTWSDDNLTFGDGTTGTSKDVVVDTGAANLPALRYDISSSTWKFSNDGQSFSDMGSGGGATDWENPGTIGSETPNSGVFSTLQTNSDLVIRDEDTNTVTLTAPSDIGTNYTVTLPDGNPDSVSEVLHLSGVDGTANTDFSTTDMRIVAQWYNNHSYDVSSTSFFLSGSGETAVLKVNIYDGGTLNPLSADLLGTSEGVGGALVTSTHPEQTEVKFVFDPPITVGASKRMWLELFMDSGSGSFTAYLNPSTGLAGKVSTNGGSTYSNTTPINNRVWRSVAGAEKVLVANPSGELTWDETPRLDMDDSPRLSGALDARGHPIVDGLFKVYSRLGTNQFFAGSGNVTMTGTGNLGVGDTALLNNTTGGNNVAIGINALKANTTGAGSVGVGTNACAWTTGTSNTCVGNFTGSFLETGSFNTLIGEQAEVAGAAITNSICLGFFCFVDESDKIRFGDDFVTKAEFAPNTTVSAGTALTFSSPRINITNALVPSSRTSTPCSTFPEGALFYNNTSDYMCFCDGAQTAKQMHSPATDCF